MKKTALTVANTTAPITGNEAQWPTDTVHRVGIQQAISRKLYKTAVYTLVNGNIQGLTHQKQ